jgi:hypothetical protein
MAFHTIFWVETIRLGIIKQLSLTKLYLEDGFAKESNGSNKWFKISFGVFLIL